MDLFLSIVYGIVFGFILYKVGAASPSIIINMLRLKNFHLAKVILFAIGLSSTVLFVLASVGAIEPHFSIKSAYIGVVVGGLIFGLGWAIAGFCPGTGIVALGAGRKDAIYFIVGGLVGAYLFMLSYSFVADTFLLDSLLGGKSTLATTGKSTPLLASLPSFLVAGVIGFVFIGIAFFLPKKQV